MAYHLSRLAKPHTSTRSVISFYADYVSIEGHHLSWLYPRSPCSLTSLVPVMLIQYPSSRQCSFFAFSSSCQSASCSKRLCSRRHPHRNTRVCKKGQAPCQSPLMPHAAVCWNKLACVIFRLCRHACSFSGCDPGADGPKSCAERVQWAALPRACDYCV